MRREKKRKISCEKPDEKTSAPCEQSAFDPDLPADCREGGKTGRIERRKREKGERGLRCERFRGVAAEEHGERTRHGFLGKNPAERGDRHPPIGYSHRVKQVF